MEQESQNNTDKQFKKMINEFYIQINKTKNIKFMLIKN